jgi:hypothetical protein
VGLRRSASGEPDIAHSRHPHRHAGLTFTGIIIALAVHAATFALAAHDAAAKVR